MDRKKRKALSALEVTSCYSCVARIDKNTTSVSAGHNKQGYKIYFWNIVKLYLKYGLDLAAVATSFPYYGLAGLPMVPTCEATPMQ